VTRDEFLAGLAQALEWPADRPFNSATRLKGDPAWDSVAVLSAMTFVQDVVGVILPATEYEGVEVANDLVALVADQLS
jgi:acyl carrier protein